MVPVIAIIVGVPRTIQKNLEKRLRNRKSRRRIETALNIALRSVRILYLCRSEENCCHSNPPNRQLLLVRTIHNELIIIIIILIIIHIIGTLGTVTKGLVHGLEEMEIRRRVETIQTTSLLRSAKILRRVLET